GPLPTDPRARSFASHANGHLVRSARSPTDWSWIRSGQTPNNVAAVSAPTPIRATDTTPNPWRARGRGNQLIVAARDHHLAVLPGRRARRPRATRWRTSRAPRRIIPYPEHREHRRNVATRRAA